ncbi:hypothetical protein K0M31_003648 [Melipona bicolor]|uniref:Uncharacterized protein n=1 Tax=Melipona bicolor TaxID=60889 RepID=A0AA40G098_9HYME|nr:hypothetical protein K0M31_003648 [Melipona bicolor]
MPTLNQATLACQPVSSRLSLEERDTCRAQVLAAIPEQVTPGDSFRVDPLQRVRGCSKADSSRVTATALCDSSDLVTSRDTSTIRKSVTGLAPVTGIPQLESRPLCRATTTYTVGASERQSEKRIMGTNSRDSVPIVNADLPPILSTSLVKMSWRIV